MNMKASVLECIDQQSAQEEFVAFSYGLWLHNSIWGPWRAPQVTIQTLHLNLRGPPRPTDAIVWHCVRTKITHSSWALFWLMHSSTEALILGQVPALVLGAFSVEIWSKSWQIQFVRPFRPHKICFCATLWTTKEPFSSHHGTWQTKEFTATHPRKPRIKSSDNSDLPRNQGDAILSLGAWGLIVHCCCCCCVARQPLQQQQQQSRGINLYLLRL